MKLKYILPVATIASVATAITPVAASCGSSVINLDTQCPLQEVILLSSKNSRDFKVGKTYTAKIDVSLFSKDAQYDLGTNFMVSTDVKAESFVTLSFDSDNVTVDGTKLTKVSDGKKKTMFNGINLLFLLKQKIKRHIHVYLSVHTLFLRHR